mgnify:CR=1 FL=1
MRYEPLQSECLNLLKLVILRSKDDELYYLIYSYNLFAKLKLYSDASLLEKGSANNIRTLLVLVDSLWDRLTKFNNEVDLNKFKIKFEKDGGYNMFERI